MQSTQLTSSLLQAEYEPEHGMEGTTKKAKLDDGNSNGSSSADIGAEAIVVVFTLEDEIRALIRALKVFEVRINNIAPAGLTW